MTASTLPGAKNTSIRAGVRSFVPGWLALFTPVFSAGFLLEMRAIPHKDCACIAQSDLPISERGASSLIIQHQFAGCFFGTMQI